MKEQVSNAVSEKDWGWLIPYAVFVLFVVIVVVAGGFTAIGSGLSWFGVIKENLYAPRIELKYEKQNETKSGDEYVTTFRLRSAIPQGLYRGKQPTYDGPKGCDKDRTQVVFTGTEIAGESTYLITAWEITCKTKEPLGGDRLFELE